MALTEIEKSCLDIFPMQMQLKDKKKVLWSQGCWIVPFLTKSSELEGMDGRSVFISSKATHLLLLFADPPKKSQKRIEWDIPNLQKP
jgi:hypothetical protein